MKKTAKVSGSNNGFKSVLPRKKRRGGVLEDGSGETDDTTESDSIDMEEKCLVKETSFDYGEGDAFAKRDPNQTLTGSKIKTKKALDKPLDKINFLSSDIDNDVLLDTPLELLSPLKNLVNISVRKSFTLNIGLDKVVGKSSQEKLQVVRKLFSKINGFGEVSTLSKFVEIIRASKKAKKAKILVNTNLQKYSGCLDRTVVVKKIPVSTLAKTVHAILSKFGLIKSIKMQLVGLWQKAMVKFEQSILIGKDAVCVARSDMGKKAWNEKDVHRALLYTLSVGTNAHNIWNYVNSVGEKTCTINHHPITYIWARCAIVCFELAKSLDAIMDTTPVLRDINLHWSRLGFSKCAECRKTGHMSLSCSVSENFSPGKFSHKVLLDVDKSRLAAIYSKHSAPIACLVAFGEISWAKIAGGSLFPPLLVKNNSINPGFSLKIKSTLFVAFDIEKKFAVLENSLTSLAEQISELAKKLNSLVLAVDDIVMGKGSSVATSGKTAALLESFFFPNMVKFKNMLEGLSTSVLSLLAHLDNLVLTGSVHL
ncbi:hypothetical protein G9A89_005183 [Geosiphon pyriformis]|nr:hypothetical protein G9A89_005183 [Geosiphon pyriformis]